MYFKFRKPKNEEWIPEQKSGILKVEVPHWSAEVRIFDSQPQPVAELAKIKQDSNSKSGYSLEAVLEPGAYQVQISLQGKTESRWFQVNKGKVTQVSQKAWEKLKFTSAFPIKEADNFNATHAARASEMSRQRTWTYPPGGNSRLFLFVRTLDPKSYGETFSDGLQLLDANGEVMTDFSEGIEKNKRQGWMAFNADLPSGGYILRRGRSGVRLRYQVLYLCDGWETQIFVNGRHFPSLHTWSLNMARMENGFEPSSEALVASEAITDRLRYSAGSLFLLQNEKIKESIDVLLDVKMENPWLGVLAAHAILRLREQTETLQLQLENLRSRKSSESILPPKQLEAEIFAAQDYFTVLEQKVKPFLQRVIGDHPDVRALFLSNDLASDQPFDFPPSLLAGLQRIQAHSLLFADTILLDSLTDYVVESLVFNSPWTAWRYLAGQPKSDFSSAAASKKLQIKQSAASVSDFSVSAILSQTAAPRTPVYRLAEVEDDSPAQLSRTATETILRDAPMIQKVKERVINYAKNYEPDSLRDPINFDSGEEISKVLAQVTPEEISQNFGIPLTRTAESLKALHSQAAALTANIQADELDEMPPVPAASGQSLVSVQQAILEYALTKFGKSESEASGTAQNLPRFTIREIVNKIQSEADRLTAAAFAQGSAVPSNVMLPSAERLYAIAESLLRHADFVLVTDSNEKILYSNGAFLLLISPKSDNRAKITERETAEMRSRKQKEWEMVLQAAPVGMSDVISPYENEEWRHWSLSRTEIEDRARGRSVSYLNLLRLSAFMPLNEALLGEINAVSAGLTYYVPRLVFSNLNDMKLDEANLLMAIDQLEELVKRNQ